MRHIQSNSRCSATAWVVELPASIQNAILLWQINHWCGSAYKIRNAKLRKRELHNVLSVK